MHLRWQNSKRAGSDLYEEHSDTAPLPIQSGGASTVAIPATTAADTVVKATPGRLCRVLVTVVGTAAVHIFDNASGHTGTEIGTIAASAAAGTVVIFDMPAANGIVVQGSANLPGLTIAFI